MHFFQCKWSLPVSFLLTPWAWTSVHRRGSRGKENVAFDRQHCIFSSFIKACRNDKSITKWYKSGTHILPIGQKYAPQVVIRWYPSGHQVITKWPFSGHKVTIKWSPSGHKLLTRWYPNGTEVVMSYVIFILHAIFQSRKIKLDQFHFWSNEVGRLSRESVLQITWATLMSIFYVEVWTRAVESEFKSNPIFPICSDFPILSDFLSDFIWFLSDFFRFLDFSRLLDLPIPQL